jgi:hypothetical protein
MSHVIKNKSTNGLFSLYILQVNQIMKANCVNTWIPMSDLKEVEFLTTFHGYFHLGLQQYIDSL